MLRLAHSAPATNPVSHAEILKYKLQLSSKIIHAMSEKCGKLGHNALAKNMMTNPDMRFSSAVNGKTSSLCPSRMT